MKYLIPIIFILLLTPSFASPAQEFAASLSFILKSENILDYNLQELKTTYNNNLDKIPWIVKQIIGNEKINFYLTLNTGEIITLSGTTKSAKIIQAQIGALENPTLNIYITENTINRLKNKQVTIQKAIDTEEIRYESQRIRTSVKSWFGRRLLTIASWF